MERRSMVVDVWCIDRSFDGCGLWPMAVGRSRRFLFSRISLGASIFYYLLNQHSRVKRGA